MRIKTDYCITVSKTKESLRLTGYKWKGETHNISTAQLYTTYALTLYELYATPGFQPFLNKPNFFLERK